MIIVFFKRKSLC